MSINLEAVWIKYVGERAARICMAKHQKWHCHSGHAPSHREKLLIHFDHKGLEVMFIQYEVDKMNSLRGGCLNVMC